MPKAKYLYKNKRIFHNGQRQEGVDGVYFNSPKYAKEIAKKVGVHTKDIERAMQSYFDFMKESGLSKHINTSKVSRFVHDLEVVRAGSLKGALGITAFYKQEIWLLKSFKAKDYTTLFHELNHYFSKNENYDRGDDDYLGSTGFQYSTPESDGFRAFNEGFTEYLSKLQESYHERRHSRLYCYSTFTAFARAMCFIAGKHVVYSDYFNGGDLSLVTRKLNEFGISREELENLADEISYLGEVVGMIGKKKEKNIEDEVVYDWVYGNVRIQETLIDFFGKKVSKEINQHEVNSETFGSIVQTVLNMYMEFAKVFVFGRTAKGLANSNRRNVFTSLVNSYLANIDEIKLMLYFNENNIAEEEQLSLSEDDILNICYDENSEELSEELFDLFKNINNCEYALVNFDEDEITFENCYNKEVEVYEEGYANYLRTRKGLRYGYGKTRDMDEGASAVAERVNKRANKVLYKFKKLGISDATEQQC